MTLEQVVNDGTFIVTGLGGAIFGSICATAFIDYCIDRVCPKREKLNFKKYFRESYDRTFSIASKLINYNVSEIKKYN